MNSIPTLVEVKEFIAAADKDLLSPIEILILRNITVEGMTDYLNFIAVKQGFNSNICFGGFDNIMQDTFTGVVNDQQDIILVINELEMQSTPLSWDFAGKTNYEIELEIERLSHFCENVVKNIRKRSRAVILWCAYSIPNKPVLGIGDFQSEISQIDTIYRLNRNINEILNKSENSYLLDINRIIMQLGAEDFFDSRGCAMFSAPWSNKAFFSLSQEIFHYVNALKGRIKKCLVLDCDNTLWGGIVGEDGLSGIKLASSYPGNTYKSLQREVLNLVKQGIIIAICSKNNESDVFEVFESHPDMILKREHIAAWRINWKDKAANIREIATELNIGLDSIVFMDDSEYEINLVKGLLPEVECILLDAKRSYLYHHMLRNYACFNKINLTSEDLNKTNIYLEESGRRKLKETITDIDSFLQSLELYAIVKPVDTFTIPRIAQLTQKTNQFNLTGKRYSEVDISRFSESSEYDVLYMSLKDKFGDYGIIGAAILRYYGSSAEIDTFLISCRALSRGAEDFLLATCVKRCLDKGIHRLIGRYIKTAKNEQVEEFYPLRGFVKTSEYGVSEIETKNFAPKTIYIKENGG